MLDGHLWLAISRLHLQTPRPLVIESVAIGCASIYNNCGKLAAGGSTVLHRFTHGLVRRASTTLSASQLKADRNSIAYRKFLPEALPRLPFYAPSRHGSYLPRISANKCYVSPRAANIGVGVLVTSAIDR
jgi:hypothetical protein